MSSTTVGPVCHIPPANTTAKPQPVDIPGVGPPAQPTLQSLQQTVNNLRQIIMFITGQQGPAGQNGSNAKSKPARWVEDKPSRVTNTVRVFQNNDTTSKNFVDIETIDGVTMKDGVTGESWKWTR